MTTRILRLATILIAVFVAAVLAAAGYLLTGVVVAALLFVTYKLARSESPRRY